ncbi:hypothetical protein V8G54_000210, partial (mitochondrion) [Vigna mungo]
RLSSAGLWCVFVTRRLPSIGIKPCHCRSSRRTFLSVLTQLTHRENALTPDHHPHSQSSSPPHHQKPTSPSQERLPRGRTPTSHRVVMKPPRRRCHCRATSPQSLSSFFIVSSHQRASSSPVLFLIPHTTFNRTSAPL